MPSWSRSGLVTKMSSPTSWSRSPSRSVVELPAVPVVLGVAVLERDDGELVHEPRVEVRHLGRRRLAALEAVDAVGEELARRRIERDRDLLPVAGLLGRVEDRLDRRLARGQVGREAALVADGGGEALLLQHLLQRVVRLRADLQRLGERLGARRDDHELLQVDRVGRVHAAVDHVHHRHRQRPRALAAEVAEERLALLRRGGVRGGERDAEDRVRAEAALVRRAVELDQLLVELLLLVGLHAPNRLEDLAVHIRDRLRHGLAAEGVAAVAQLDRLVDAGGGAGRDRRAAVGAGLQHHLDLDGGVAARVEDLAGVDVGDTAHSEVSLARSK